jgi:hypothetical protein
MITLPSCSILTRAGDAALALAAEELLVGLYVDNRFKTGDRVDKPVVVEVRERQAKPHVPHGNRISSFRRIAVGRVHTRLFERPTDPTLPPHTHPRASHSWVAPSPRAPPRSPRPRP